MAALTRCARMRDLVVGVALFWLAAACTGDGARPTGVVQAPDSADQVLEGFSHYVTRTGVRQTYVRADTAFFYEPTQTTELRRVRIIFYDKNGGETSTLTAKRGVYRWQDGSMEAYGNVVVKSSAARVLRTEALRYDDEAKQISTNVAFTFDRGGEHLVGNAFRSDPDFKNVVTSKPRGTAEKGALLPGQ